MYQISILIIALLLNIQLFGMENAGLEKRQIALGALNKGIEAVIEFQKNRQEDENKILELVDQSIEHLKNRREILITFKEKNNTTYKTVIAKLKSMNEQNHFDLLFNARAIISENPLLKIDPYHDNKLIMESAIKVLSDGIQELDPAKIGSEILLSESESDSGSDLEVVPYN